MSPSQTQLETYLRACSARGLSEHTERAYRNDLQGFLLWLSSQAAPNPMTQDTFEQWSQHLLDRGLAASTRRRHLASLRAWLRWIEKTQGIHFPTSNLPRIKVPKTLPRNVPLTTLALILDQARSEFTDADYQKLLFFALTETLTQTGIRIGEACSLTLASLDAHSSAFRVMGKGLRERSVYIANSTSKKILSVYLLKHPTADQPSSPFFAHRDGRALSTDAARRIIHKHTKLLSISQRITPHMFRHSTATEMLANGADIRSVQRLLGHSSLAVTEVYTHVSDALLREVVTKSNPRNSIESCADN